MELNHDWRAFRAAFQPRRKSPLVKGLLEGTLSGPIHVLNEGKVIVAAVGATSEDLQEWSGRLVTDLATAFPARELILFDRKEADSRMSQSLTLPHFYDQTESIRVNSIPQTSSVQGKIRKYQPVEPGHFVLQAIQGWWAKILPSSYGLFLRLEAGAGAAATSSFSDAPQEVFVLVRRGRLELFHTPDLASVGAERARNGAAVVKYLSEKHGVPVQGLMVSAKDWADWSDPSNAGEAWRSLALAIQSHEAQLVPFRWQIMTLVATRAFLGL